MAFLKRVLNRPPHQKVHSFSRTLLNFKELMPLICAKQRIVQTLWFVSGNIGYPQINKRNT